VFKNEQHKSKPPLQTLTRLAVGFGPKE